jgi:hypothetical protein
MYEGKIVKLSQIQQKTKYNIVILYVCIVYIFEHLIMINLCIKICVDNIT